MKLIILETTDQIADAAAKIIADQIINTPNPIIGLATGSSPIKTYQKLIDMNQNKTLDFSQVRTFNLDEYIGLSKTHPQSYYYFMNKYFFNHININKDDINFPSGIGNSLKNANDYNNLLNDHKIDIQLLGLGVNGHIGFNEPGTNFDSETHIVQLSENTINTNARFFDNIKEVPHTAITMGISNIIQAKKILLIAYGTNKAKAIQKLVESPIDKMWPCTILQTHPDTTLIIDQAAASLLKKK